MKEMIKKSDLLKAMARIQPSAENYDAHADDETTRNASIEDSAYWAARDMFDDIMFQIQQVTDAKTEYAPVVHGHWKTPEKHFPFWDWKCSACGCEEYRQRDSHGNYRMMNFCPNCGAKMDERSGEE